MVWEIVSLTCVVLVAIQALALIAKGLLCMKQHKDPE